MAIGMGPLDLKKAPPKLNSELASPAAKKSIATSAGNARSSAAHIITISSAAHTSGNIFFTPASSWGHRPRPVTGRNMSLAANYRRAAGQRFNSYANRFWQSPSLSLANQANIAYKQSTASSIGEALGALAGLVTTGANAYKTLNDAGVFNKKSSNTGGAAPKGSKDLTQQVSRALGDGPKISADSLSSTGLRTASSFGANFNSDYNSIKSAIESGNFDNPNKIMGDVNKLVISATEDFYDAQGTLNVLQAQQSDASAKLETMQNDVQTTEADMKQANKDLGTNQSVLKSAKDSRQKMDEVLAKDNQEYKTACDDVTAKETEKQTAQTGVTTCKSTLASAEAKLTQATAQLTTARNQLQSIPQDAEHALQRQAAERAVKMAEQAEQTAQQEKETAQKNLQDAEGKLKDAESNLQKAQTTKSDLLTKYEGDKTKDQTAVKNCKDAEANVQRSQKQYDTQVQTADICQANYEKAKTTLDGANSVIKQANDLSGRMKDLEQNVKNADKLQKSAEKSVNKYLKNNDANAGELPEVKVTGSGKKIKDMNLQELLAKREELDKVTGEARDTEGIALVDKYLDKYKNTIAPPESGSSSFTAKTTTQQKSQISQDFENKMSAAMNNTRDTSQARELVKNELSELQNQLERARLDGNYQQVNQLNAQISGINSKYGQFVS